MKKFLNEFKAFAMRGNVLDMAVGVIIGSSFTAIVNSMVADILTPILGIFTQDINFSELYIQIYTSKIMIGNFINALISFVMIAFVIFILIKFINRFKKQEEIKKEVKPSEEILLLSEIRDLLKDKA